MPDVKEVQIHPSERLPLPGGAGHADVDVEMVPLVRALWADGYTTVGCCQNLGESIEHNGHRSPVALQHRRRWAEFYRGHAWLSLPAGDARRLIGALGTHPVFGERVRRWTHPDAWMAVGYLFPTADGRAEPEPLVQVSFPAAQIGQLLVALNDMAAASH